MPVFIWELVGEKPGYVHLLGFYGIPAIDGPAGGVKMAGETYTHPMAPDDRQHAASEAEIEDTYRRFVAPHLPWLGPRPLRTASCLYTSTRENRFLIDRHPDHESVLIVSPCSGHGFKHSPAIGEAIAQWAGDGELGSELRPFALSEHVAGAGSHF
jgi:sarcosine oxidase